MPLCVMANTGHAEFEVRNAVVVVVLTFVVSAILVQLLTWLRNVLWEPLRLKRFMAKQGVGGPPFRFLVGNQPEASKYAHSFPEALPLDDEFGDFSPTVTPQYALYFPKYGNRFVYWCGSETRLVVKEPEIAKIVLGANHEDFKKSEIDGLLTSLIVGKGLFHLFGPKWAIERQTLNPFFHTEALKGYVEAMVKASAVDVKAWEHRVAEAGGSLEFDVHADIHTISGRVLSYTAFGYDSFEKGQQIYNLQAQHSKNLFEAFHRPTFWIPGFKFLPTRQNKLMQHLDTKIDTLLHEIIDSRRKSSTQTKTGSPYGDDLLGHMLAASSDGLDEDVMEFNLASVFNNCKLFYFAGQDTVATTILYTMMMLARYPEWQDRARQEVLNVVGRDDNFDSGKLHELRISTLNESMRLFSVATSANTRITTKDMEVGDLIIPKGMVIKIARQAMHKDPEYWGEDAGKFNPGRFADGVLKASKHPQAFIPLGYGSKVCIAMAFAMNKMKIILSMILKRFQLVPSPLYKHHPTVGLVQMPKHGMHLILKSLA